MNWLDSLYIFKAVAEQQSFSAASRKLNISAAKTTLIIQQLEKHLRITLFVRTTRQLYLTEEAQKLLKQISVLLETWEGIYFSFKNNASLLTGTLRIGVAPDVLSTPLFSTVLAQFLQLHGRLTVCSKTYHQPLSLIDEVIDVFIGTENYIKETGYTVAKKLLAFHFICCASPGYIKKQGRPIRLEDLSQHNCIIYADDTIWNFGSRKIKVSGNFYADNGKMLFSAACNDIGIVRVPDFMARPYIDNKTLVPLFGDISTAPIDLKIFYPKVKYQSRKITEIVNFLVQKIKSA